jgi:hypothetical protein
VDGYGSLLVLDSGHVAQWKRLLTVSRRHNSSSSGHSQYVHEKTEFWPARQWHLNVEAHSQMYFADVGSALGDVWRVQQWGGTTAICGDGCLVGGRRAGQVVVVVVWARGVRVGSVRRPVNATVEALESVAFLYNVVLIRA